MEKKNPNRLIKEKSPYLLKHAGNPVDWYPWGGEAFERARREDRPVFLSIGYSTCHWCNVMEEESFSDPEVAGLMNETFVSVKVDREERPDIDNVYMTVCQMLTGRGGWPLTVIMTPEKKPFFAGTYYPKHSAGGRIGMMELIPRVRAVWEGQREDALRSAEKITSKLQEISGAETGEAPDAETLAAAYRELEGRFDEARGGFGPAPKFPMPHNIMFLLRYWRRTGEERALSMAEKTLGDMRLGGMYDQLGYGFHRYSTDARWLVPHFEKMLYDQALLAMAYAEAFQATGKREYAQTAKEVFAFVLRDMTSAEGAFHSALGADVEGEEGKFYLWREEEVRSSLATDEADLVCGVFNISGEGNFVHEIKGEKTGENILFLRKPLARAAADFGAGEDEARRAMQKLHEAREKRTHPDLDDKVLTDWNGLMVAALAKGAQALGETGYAGAAGRAADFVLENMRDTEGRLLHRWREGQAALRASADDYAFFIWGLIELYEADFEVRRLDAAVELMERFLRDFRGEKGGFYFTPAYGEELPARRVELYDAAAPSANSVALMDLLRLGRLTSRFRYIEEAGRIMEALGGSARRSPSAHAMFLSGVDFALGPSSEVVVVGRPGAKDTEAMLRTLRSRFIPNKVVLLRPAGEESPDILRHADFMKDYKMLDAATAYVCADYTCELPTTDAEKMLGLLGVRE